MDHSTTDQSSVVRFAEDNWKLGRLGAGSTGASEGSLAQLFAFNREPRTASLFLDPVTGQVTRRPSSH